MVLGAARRARYPSAMKLSLIDAFTTTAGAGNRAGFCREGDDHDDRARQRAAAALAVSETAFVVTPPAGADACLRYFTPTQEVPFCGHATVAALHRLAELGEVAVGRELVLDTRAGRQGFRLEREGDGVRVWLSTPQYPFRDSPVEERVLLAALGGEAGMLDRELPVRHAGPKLLVPFRRRADLFGLAPRWGEVAALAEVGVLGVFAFTRDTVEPDSVAHGRFFAPAQGIREDPVTGAANGPLAAYLVAQGVLSKPARAQAEQGDAMGKPGRVALAVDEEGGVRIGGRAVTVLVGETA